jgi:DNA-binding SARP family transcriptional activator/predicted negative regulator of RcsB-dependent stress response/DNA-binding XRE family transcriptional regulator
VARAAGPGRPPAGAGEDPGRLGALIEERRRAAGLTQRALAERAGVSVGAIRDLEQGRTSWPRPGATRRLAEALGLDQQHLTRLAGPPPGQAGAGHARGPAQDVRLAVLGPLAASRGGVPVDLGGERQRAVLALLAISAGQAVHRAGIIDAIWGEAPPPSAISMIQSYVSRLRDALGLPARAPAAGHRGRLTSVGESYLLEPGPGQVDLQEFAAWAAQARQRAAGDAAGACDLYARALGLWRGEAAADVRLLRGHPAVAALARQRTAVILEYAEVAAAAGRSGRVLEQLRALAEREPLDERVLARLMMALGATGQQAAALRVFEEARTRLDQELGVTPGQELAGAHLRILRGEADPPGSAGGSREGRVLPRQLPSAVRHFAGREAELEALWEALDQAGPPAGAVVISAIGGMAGVGKTALAVHWAQEAADRFPDGQLFADLRGAGPAGDPAEPGQVIGWFLASLGVPAAQVPADPQAQAALLRSVLADKRMLIVLDNAAGAGQVRPLLPGSPGCLVLITSRARLTGLAAADGATVLDLDVLDTHEATELLARRLGPSRVAEPAAAELVELCGRLPLALAITAARAAARPGFPLAAMAGELRHEAGRLDALDTGEPASSVRQVFSWSYRQLTSPAATMFRLLGVHPGPGISAPAAASLAGVSPAAARHALTELTGAHLLTEPSPGRYALHDLLRAYATELATGTDPGPDRHEALGRVLDHYLHTAHAAALQITPNRPPVGLGPVRAGVLPECLAGREQAAAWFGAEQQVLFATIAQAAQHGFGAHAWQLPWTLVDFLNREGRWIELAAIQRVALKASERLGDEAGQARTLVHLALACTRTNEHDQACVHLAHAIPLYQCLGDDDGEAIAQQALAAVYDQQGRFADAIDHTERALTLYRATGNRVRQAQCLSNTGWFQAQLGDYQQARVLCEQGLAISGELGDRYAVAMGQDSLGYVEHKLGHLVESAGCYRQALVILRDLGDRYFETVILTRLGEVLCEDGDRQAAREAWRQALSILDDLDHPDAAGVRDRLREPAPQDR